MHPYFQDEHLTVHYDPVSLRRLMALTVRCERLMKWRQPLCDFSLFSLGKEYKNGILSIQAIAHPQLMSLVHTKDRLGKNILTFSDDITAKRELVVLLFHLDVSDYMLSIHEKLIALPLISFTPALMLREQKADVFLCDIVAGLLSNKEKVFLSEKSGHTILHCAR